MCLTFWGLGVEGGLTRRIHSVIAQASASQIGSRVASGVDLYSVVKELVGRLGEIRREPGHRISFLAAAERDQTG
jgi:hypothetical protein